MRNLFYLKLALTNLRNNKQTCYPYIFACTTIIALYYILDSIADTCLSENFHGAGHVGLILKTGVVIASLVSILIVFYTNSFLMKRRKKELGLYSVLGMEKRHVARVLFCETAVTGLISLSLGILAGILLNRLIFLMLLNLLRIPVDVPFAVPGSSLLLTGGLFTGIFLLVMLHNFRQIRLADPITLLHSGRFGEREPKSKRLLTLFGLAALGGGYFLAVWAATPSDALTVFFPAVLLVVAGTYLLFTSGSIVFLKTLRKRKAFYYRPQNFIAVSGMIYRMKQNAVGLANICILSTCVLATLSVTVCFYVGEEDLLTSRFPHDVITQCSYTEGNIRAIRQTAERHAKRYAVTVEDPIGYAELNFNAVRTEDAFGKRSTGITGTAYEMELLLLEDYNRLTGQQKQLLPGEALVSTNGEIPQNQTLFFGDQPVRVREQIDTPEFLGLIPVTKYLMAVVPDLNSLETLQAALSGGDLERHPIWYQFHFNLRGSEQACLNYMSGLRDALNETVERLATVNSIFTARLGFYAIDGSLVFLGIFFVLLFAIITVLIMYYKQITEGYEDHGRFRIMRQVGLDDRETKRTIRQQVLIVFFLPLTVAVLHMAFAFPAMNKLLVVFNMTNTLLFFGCTAVSAALFAVFYFLAYQATAKTYYLLVHSDE